MPSVRRCSASMAERGRPHADWLHVEPSGWNRLDIYPAEEEKKEERKKKERKTTVRFVLESLHVQVD